MSKRKPKQSSPASPAADGSPTASSPGSTEKTARGVSEVEPAPAQTVVMSGLPPLSRILSVVVLIMGILVVGALFLKVMAGFFVPLFLAALLVVLFRPVHEWIYRRVGKRPRIAAIGTTTIVLLMVLMPVIGLVSVAASQFTAILSHVDFENLSGTLDRARTHLGIALDHPQQFRRLDKLATSLDQSFDEESGETVNDDDATILGKINEAEQLLTFLHDNVEGPIFADADAEIARDQLDQFRLAVDKHANAKADDDSLISNFDTKEEFDRQSVRASAAIRTWMRSKLGGTFRSQVCLFANPSAEDFRELLRQGREVLQPRFVSFTSEAGNFVLQAILGLTILIVAVYFFLIDGASMVQTLMRLSPLDDDYERQLLLEFDRTSRAVVLATILSAVAQGFLTAVAFWYCGFSSVVLIFLLTTLMALVPFVGATVVWVPGAIYLAAVDQNYLMAGLLALWGMAVVSTIDNFIKPWVLQGRTTLHPLFALLSVIGGIGVFGPVGLIVGPMVVVFLQTLLEILNHELAVREKTDPPQQQLVTNQQDSESNNETQATVAPT